MAFRCPRCGRDMTYGGFATKLGQMFGWVCTRCDIFLSSKEIKRLVCKP